jgi:perosamine synthetase
MLSFGKKIVACEIGPNYQLDDTSKSLKILLLPFLTKSGSFKEVQNWFNNYLKRNAEDQVWLVDSGRTALWLLLKNLNLPAQSEVIIQAFSCVVVPNSVLQSNLKPVVCDIDETTYNFDLDKLEQSITPKTKVLIIQYSFGIIPDMGRVLDICKKHNLILIEDCAHSLGAEYEDKKIGNIGDAAIFSFGRDKIISSTIGGAAIINNKDKDWQEKVQQDFQDLPKMRYKRVIQSLFYLPLITLLVKPFYHLNIGKMILFSSQKAGIAEPVYTSEEARCTDKVSSPSKFSFHLAELLLTQLRKFEKMSSHRRKLAQFYASELDLTYQKNNIYLRFPVNLQFFGNQDISAKKKFSKLFAALRVIGVLPGNWYSHYFLPKTVDCHMAGVEESALPVTTKLLGAVINFPTNINTTQKDAEKIVSVVKNELL